MVQTKLQNKNNKSPVSAKDVAKYFIGKASSSKYASSSSGITNLQLQKLLFYAQAEYFNKHQRKLFEEEIQAWDYGPVVKEVYDWLKPCGGYNIIDFDIDQSSCKEIRNKDLKLFLDKVWKDYSKYSAWFLTEKTHKRNSVWDKVYKRGENETIPLEALKDVELVQSWK